MPRPKSPATKQERLLKSDVSVIRRAGKSLGMVRFRDSFRALFGEQIDKLRSEQEAKKKSGVH